jgi:hypothetical protein
VDPAIIGVVDTVTLGSDKAEFACLNLSEYVFSKGRRKSRGDDYSGARVEYLCQLRQK